MRRLIRVNRFVPLLGGALLLAACAGSDISDLQAWVEETKGKPGGRIEPLPEIKPYEAYTYKGSKDDARNPFEPFYAVRERDTSGVQTTGLSKEIEKEIRDRNREELEQYELDSLRMVGTMENQDEQWGIVLDPGGVVHRVRVGNYLGKNIGKIVNIFEDKIELREIVQNSQGRWEERQAAMALSE
jgi:type IV pilus assembly protein PilP